MSTALSDTPIVPHLGILLIDLQTPFLRLLPHPVQEKLLQRVRFTVRVASALRLPLLATEQIPEKLGPTDPGLINEPAIKTSPRVSKSSFSALGEDAVDNWLEDHQIEHLLIAGLETHICIYQTAIDALGREIGTTVLADCVAGRQPEMDASIFAAIRHADGHVLPSETIFHSLIGDATHPAFRTFNELVKDGGKNLPTAD